MATLKQMMDFAKENPKSKEAEKLFNFIKEGAADEKARIEGIDLSRFGRPKFINLNPEQVQQAQNEAGQLRLEASKGKGMQFLEKGLPIAGLIGGSILGAPGGLPGRALGAGVGTGAAEAAIEKIKGEELQPKKILKEGIKGAGTEIIATGIIKVGGMAINAAKPTIKNLLHIAKTPLEAAGKVGK